MLRDVREGLAFVRGRPWLWATLLAAAIVVYRGQIVWFSLLALVGIIVLSRIGVWYRQSLAHHHAAKRHASLHRETGLTRKRVIFSLGILIVLVFSKYFYLTSINTYLTFYLIHTFGVSVKSAQVHLFLFLAASAAGTLIGGPVGDRIGRKPVIWGSILGVAPFALALPHVGLAWTTAFTILIGLILSSAFSAILVYAQELIPGKVGMVSGVRRKRNDDANKRYASGFANGIRRWLLDDGAEDSGCGLKVFRRDVYLALPYFDNMHRFLIALVQREGYEVRFVDVNSRPGLLFTDGEIPFMAMTVEIDRFTTNAVVQLERGDIVLGVGFVLRGVGDDQRCDSFIDE